MVATLDKFASLHATAPVDRVTDRYRFVNTMDIVNRLGEHGWRPSQVKEVRARKDVGHQKHIVRFSNEDFKFEGSRPEILFINSHNLTSGIRFMLGVLEFVCENGLIVASESYGSVKLRHKGEVNAKLDEVVGRSMEEFPAIMKMRERMMNVDLTKLQQYNFAREAVKTRFNDSNYKIDPKSLLECHHKGQDTNRLWDVFNRVQENMIKGGFRAQRIETGKTRADRRVRPVSRIDLDIKINTGLWGLAEKYAAKAGLN